jgi:TolB-like protein/Flp pilus assembly protein TadD
MPGHAHAHSLQPFQHRIFDELKRRNVGRVALLYLGVCWIILDPVHVVFHMLGVPEWINRLVVVCMALGFPIALVTAWIYEVTPEGLKPSAAADLRRSLLQRTGRRLNLAIGAVLGILAVYYLVYHFWLAKRFIEPVAENAHAEAAEGASEAGVEVAQRSIAVLPFLDMSQAKDQEYLSQGLAEDLLNLLAKIPELRVAARTSAFAFKNSTDDIPTIARKLHVAHVLEGSVRKSGSRVRITAQLIRADSGYHLWSETYDRDLGDVFSLQDEIATAVVQALKIALLGGALPARPTPKNLDAYNLFLQGRFFADSHTQDGLEKAIDYLGRARDLDPTFEPTWTALAFAYSDIAARGFLSSEQALANARAAATQALKLNPKSARARVALGLIHMNIDWDWAAAQQEFKQALEYDPGNATVLVAKGYLELVFGRTSRAVALFQQALVRDPLHASSYNNLGIAHFAEGRLADAEAAFRKAIELKPTASYTHNGLGLVLLARGDHEGALKEMNKEPDGTWRLQGLAIVYTALGKQAEAEQALRNLQAGFKDSPYTIATVYAYRNDREQAFEWLERAYTERDSALASIKVDPLLKPLVDDPRYARLIKKLGLSESAATESARREGASDPSVATAAGSPAPGLR